MCVENPELQVKFTFCKYQNVYQQFFFSVRCICCLLQGLVTEVLTSLISHDSSTVETFLSKYDDVIIGVTNLLQFSPW